MSVPHGTMLTYKYNSAHADHVHVEPPTKQSGTPPTTNPGKTPGIIVIYEALTDYFGPGDYFLDSSGRYVGDDPGVYWTHMGGYNRRYIGGGTTWSQHAWWNALDIGPYMYGEQDKFINFLEGVEEVMAFNAEQEEVLKDLVASILSVDSNGYFAEGIIKDIRKDIVTANEVDGHIADYFESRGMVTKDELTAAIATAIAAINVVGSLPAGTEFQAKVIS